MSKTRIIKRQDRAYIELPSEMVQYDEVEIFTLKDGYYLISLPLDHAAGQIAKKPDEPAQMSTSEREVLKKLLSIKFENRTPPHVLKAFSDSELKILNELEKRGMVSLFKGRKYVDGVYTVPDSTYSLVQRFVPASPGPLTTLSNRGFIIINDKREAVDLSQRLSNEMKKGEVVGVKGFDNKFYLVSRDYLASARAKISAFLKQDSTLDSIVAGTKLDSDGAIAALRIMAENGDIIEKKRGLFASV